MDALPITTDVPTYGKAVYGLGRNGSYDAAKSGVIPTIPVQGKLRVPVRVALRKLAGDDASIFEALASDFLSKLKRKAAA